MHSRDGFYTQKKKYVIAALNIIMNEKWFVWRGSAYGFPRGWCSAQRIQNPMIAGGNHTTIPSCQGIGSSEPIFD